MVLFVNSSIGCSRCTPLLTETIVLVALGTALRRGELLGLHWRDVDLMEGKITVRQAYVRGEFTAPKSRASRRVIELGSRTLRALDEHQRRSVFAGGDELVFAHPERGTPLDPSRIARKYLRPALAHARITKPFRPFHDLRHTSLTHAAAAGNPQIYVQARAGHSQGAITERYMHAGQVSFPGAAERSEDRIFGLPSDHEPNPRTHADDSSTPESAKPDKRVAKAPLEASRQHQPDSQGCRVNLTVHRRT